jgi:hypothetical protein
LDRPQPDAANSLADGLGCDHDQRLFAPPSPRYTFFQTPEICFVHLHSAGQAVAARPHRVSPQLV